MEKQNFPSNNQGTYGDDVHNVSTSNGQYYILKIFFYGEFNLLDKDLLEGVKVVLFVEDEHRLLIVYGINCAKAQWTVSVGHQYGIAGNAGRPLVAIGKGLDIGKQNKGV